MTERICDNKSVGVIVSNEKDEILLLNRAKFPFGLAAPAGHIDDHGSPETAAVTEVFEEVGLVIAKSSLEKVIEDRLVDDNICRRQGGDYHVWNVYKAKCIGQSTKASEDETLGLGWYSMDGLQELADSTRSKRYKNTVAGAQILELVWLDFFTELGYVENRIS